MSSAQKNTKVKPQRGAKSFSFQSESIHFFFTLEKRRNINDWCPPFLQDLLMELYEQCRGMDFYKPVEIDGTATIGMFDRSIEQICELVDWTCEIWHQTTGHELRSRKLTAYEFACNVPLRDGWSSRDSLRFMLEGWGEDDDAWGTDYISIDFCPFPGGHNPFATPGNLSAAIGLAILDYTLSLGKESKLEDMFDSFGAAWHFALIARSLNRQQMGNQFDSKMHKARMSRAAAARYAKDPTQLAKAEVKECWKRWRENPDSYKGPTAFARDMLAKWPDELTNPQVVGRWVREWDQEAKPEDDS